MKDNKEAGFAVWFIIIVTFIVILFVSFFVWQNHAKKQDKAAIDSQLQSYTIPSSCNKTFARYNQGDGIDSVPTWQISYNCTKGITEIHSEVVAIVKNKNARIKFDKINTDQAGSITSVSVKACSQKYFANYYITGATKIDFSLQKLTC